MASVCASHEAEYRFEETAWSVVIAAGATTEPRAHVALTQLCDIYWRPIYAYLRRTGYNTHDAQDLTQSFFQDLACEQLAIAIRFPDDPPLSYGQLKLMPWWDPLRGDPCFEKIVASLAAKVPSK